MWRSKKFILVAMLIAVVLPGSALGISCSSTGDNGERLPAASQDAGAPEDISPPEGMPPGRGFSNDLFAEVAEVLGIDQQKLEDAFDQARSEMQANMSGDEQPPSAPQNASPPEGTPPEGMPPGPGFSGDLLARVAEILDIDQQTLENAFAKVQSEMPAGAAPPRPNQ